MKNKHKMILTINYTDYVLDESAAIALFKLLNTTHMEMMDSKWDSVNKVSTHYLTEVKPGNVKLMVMPPDRYAVLKLATAAIQEKEANG